ncbi:LysR substrate-binding domain-containing protein [Sciscionella sediminilitoris]|uniref:LysR substrate-binding domain-containing protein n=1 Tax=Sciscionella sediminilitoris TaxID=1445613 RepID=UPI0004DF087E|nr:LysR substrate-binding domain-containing protein [Sciscionella sp. SE31]
MRPYDLLDGRLKLRHLVLLTAVAEHGRVVKAAEHLHLTQPVVTRGIHELEAALGVTLFERGARGMTPTTAGTVFVAHARAVLLELRRAGQHLGELGEGALGTVTIGTHLAGSNLLLPRAISRLKTERPNATVVVREATPDLLLADLISGEIDMMIGRLTSPDNPRVQQYPLYREPIRLVVRTEHPACAMESPELGDLLDYPWIVPVRQTTLRQELEEVFANQGLPLPVDRTECTSMPTMRTLLLGADVIAALPSLITRDEERLVALPTPLATGRTVGVTVVPGATRAPIARLMLSQLEVVAGELRQELHSQV